MLETTEGYILRITEGQSQGQYIKDYAGDWGPDHLPTVYMLDAVSFLSQDQAASYIRYKELTCWQLEVVHIIKTVQIVTKQTEKEPAIDSQGERFKELDIYAKRNTNI